jgi:putative thioredoxin
MGARDASFHHPAAAAGFARNSRLIRMTDKAFIFEGTRENYPSLVLDNSYKGLVLVNFWSPRAAPTLMLLPRLNKLAAEYGGHFLLVNVNSDEQGELARECGVVAIPHVKAMRNGQVVGEIRSADSESSLRGFLARHLGPRLNPLYVRGIKAFQAGDLDGAMQLLAQAALEEPENLQIPADLAKILLLHGEPERAEALLSALPPEARREPRIRGLLTHLGFLRAARDAPDAETLERAIEADPNDLDARYKLSAVRLVADDYEAAMDQLVELVRRDRKYRDAAGQRGLEAIFGILGDGNAMVDRYRARLEEAID